MTSYSTPPNEKAEVFEAEAAGRGQVDRIDAMATAPGTTLESFSHLDEKKILRKMDMRLIPMLALLYLLSFLDRGNIGNAKIEGLQEDLKMSPDQYNWCLTVFFFTYAAFEVPSNLLLKKLRPSVWLPTIMIAWGIVMTLMGIVRNYHGLLVARIFLGVTEAGLFPGVAYYLTMWYCRHEIQFRQALFFSAASIAGAFSGLLAFGIAKMDGVGGLEGWRWIFILEGIVTVLVAIFAFWALYDFPETASFLTEEERAFVVFRLKYQGQQKAAGQSQSRVAQADEFKWEYVWAAFKDWQIWVNIFVYWGIVCPLYGISLFLPTIIRNLGYSSSKAQLMTVPIYITAAILAVVVAWTSDRVGKRSPFIVCISTHNPKVVYAGVFIAACAIYPAFPGVITWLANNLSGSYKRSVGMAIQIGVGNLGGAMASNFYRQKDGPRYILGHALELGFIGGSIIAALILIFSYSRINKSRDRRMAAGEHETISEEELSAKGDKALGFVQAVRPWFDFAVPPNQTPPDVVKQTLFTSIFKMSLYARQLNIDDLERSLAVETAAFPPAEAATREKVIEYRLTVCPEICIGLFLRAGASLPSPIPHDIPFVEDSASSDDVLLAHVISTKTSNKPVKDEDMDYPRNWKQDPQGDCAVGHNKNGRTIALHALAVAPDYQRAGLGKAIMRVYIQRTKSLNAADRISILTYDRLVPYYQRLGFEHYGKSESEYAGVAWHDLVSDLKSRKTNTN
ncbi:hypothetical protein FCIRC_6129 [Fusarium circinatum]|uniref:Major facilitator superfamily (MFS) profile domain-containing protein n=2 Tax=Fusarium TaxID=5506 RepID=A0A8H5X171_FUSCI|nr:hypothetical protein FCIRC_6129 [Fusarium circinatum]